MDLFKVVSDVFHVDTGVRLRLSPEQAAGRRHRLTAMHEANGEYIAASSLEFKKGEVLGIDSAAFGSKAAQAKRDQQLEKVGVSP